MKKLSLFTLLVSFLTCTKLFGQIDAKSLSKLTDLMPPSPDVAAMARYNEIPLNRSTGEVNYSLPLLTIGAGKLSYGFSLSYGSGGVKVDQTSSRVGLGWVLSGVGMVSRTIMDEPDEISIRNKPISPISARNRAMLDFLERSVLQDDGYDNQPDVFSYSFNGISGKFVLDSVGNVLQIPKTSLRIETNFSGSAYNLKITDTDGTIYYFGGTGATEFTRTLTFGLDCGSNRPSLNAGAPTAWYLKKIVHPNGNGQTRDNLEFSYVANSFSYYTSVSQTQIRSPLIPLATGCSDGYCPNVFENKTCVMQLQTNGFYLSQVCSSNGSKIKLQYTTGNRLDLPGDVMLTEISYHDADDQVVKKITCGYSFVQSNDNKLSSTVGLLTGINYRMYLQMVSEYGKAEAFLGSYKFNYYQPSALPARLSFSQDHYGFYNNKNNPSLIGASSVPLMPLASPFNQGDRSPDSNVVNIGMLSSISYPTKGKDSLVYEPHYVQVNMEVEPPLQHYYGSVRGAGSRTGVSVSSTDFYISYPQSNNLGYSCRLNESDIEYNGVHNFGRLSVTDLTTGVQVFYVAKINPDDVVNTLVSFQAGHTYRVTVTSYGDNITMDAHLEYRTGTPSNQLINQLIGGARIKKNIGLDNGQVVRYKRYFYTQLDGTPSGRVAAQRPEYYSLVKNRQFCSATNVTDYVGYECSNVIAHSNSITNLFGNGGSHIYYESCIESSGDDNFMGGGSQKKYTVAYDSPAATFIGETIPNLPMSDVSWQNGVEIYSLDFKKLNGTVVKVNEVSKHYATSATESVYGYVTRKNYVPRLINPAPGAPFPEEFYCFDGGVYMLNSVWQYLDYDISTVYDLNGANPVTTQHNYTYNPTSKLMSGNSYQLSNGQTSTTTFLYSSDYGSIPWLDGQQSIMLAQLSAEGNISAPVMVSNNVNGSIVESTRVEYQSNLLTGHILQSKIKVLNTDDMLYNTKTEFLAYDNNDRLIQSRADQLLYSSYQWGYNGQFVVAIAQNALSSEFYTNNFETLAGSSVSTGHTGKGFTTVSLVNWTPPNTRSYKISYWYRSGGVWYLRPFQSYTGTSFTMSGGDTYDDVVICPTDAQVLCYTYEPFIGMTSQTDAKGMTTYYDYDSFGRLMNVRDQNGNIVKNYTYHYKS